jgi:serine/threonine-protein kinase
MRTWGPRVLLVAAIVAGASTQAGIAHANDSATATMLFNDGKRLMGEGQFAEACPKLEESQRLDPAIGTQFNLADCYDHVGKTATSWALFVDVASSLHASGDTRREKVARERAAALEPKLSKLTILAPKNVTGLEVRRNGEVLGGAVWGNAIPVDPGSYTIEASAPGKKKWSSVAAVGPNGAAVTVTIPELVEPASADPVAVPVTTTTTTTPNASAPPASEAATTTTPDTTPASSGSTQRTLALVAGGVGVVGLGLGSVFGLQAFSKQSDSKSHCVGTVCDAEGVAAHDDAASAGTLSTIMFGAGLAFVATGAVLWFTAPKAQKSASLRVAPTVSQSSGTIMLSGRW